MKIQNTYTIKYFLNIYKPDVIRTIQIDLETDSLTFKEAQSIVSIYHPINKECIVMCELEKQQREVYSDVNEMMESGDLKQII